MATSATTTPRFWLRDPALRAERRQLLEQDGVVFTDPLLEPVMPYEPGPTIAEACDAVGLPKDLANQLGGNALQRRSQLLTTHPTRLIR